MKWLAEAWAELEAKHYGAPVARLQGKGHKSCGLLQEIKRARMEKGVPDPQEMEDLCGVQRLVVLERLGHMPPDSRTHTTQLRCCACRFSIPSIFDSEHDKSITHLELKSRRYGDPLHDTAHLLRNHRGTLSRATSRNRCGTR